MISYKYSIKEFVDYVKNKELAEIISFTHRECYEAEQKVKGGMRGAPKAREEGCSDYAEILKGLIFFLTNGVRPAGVSSWNFQEFKPIVESLIQKGIMKEDFWLKFF